MELVPALMHDAPFAVLLLAWVSFVTFYLARKAYEAAIKVGYPEASGTYFGRKVIHILGGGVVALLLPFLFKEPILPLAMALLLTVAVYIPHRTGKLYVWFQTPDNMYEVHFTLAWGLIAFILWFLDPTYWLAAVPLLYMSFGDGVTGIVRNIRYRRRVKGWEGTLGMLAVCIPIGAVLGYVGVLSAVLATLSEKQPFIDDNVAIPLVASAVLILGHFFTPALMISLY
jgi:dolichol kinase